MELLLNLAESLVSIPLGFEMHEGAVGRMGMRMLVVEIDVDVRKHKEAVLLHLQDRRDIGTLLHEYK